MQGRAVNNAVNIRPAVAGDAEALLALFRESVRGLGAGLYPPEALEAWITGLDEARLRNLLRTTRVLAAELDGELAGFCALDSDLLEMLYVHPRHAHKGVATVLLAAIETEALRQGADTLSVRVSLAAQPFFKARGFLMVRGLEVVRSGVEIFCFQMEKRLVPAT